MNRICIIGVYFGKVPNYFPLWLKSCGFNKTIDFILFTDQKIKEKPNNVIVNAMTLFEMKQLAKEKLNIESISLDEPYKCCDFKPVYGLIFDKFIEKYEYWGHCDFDLVFGDLQFFFDKYNLYAYDKFLTLGHLSMYRNTYEVNMRYKEDGARVNYLEAFTSSKSCVFDEFAGMLEIYDKNSYSMFTERIFADITPIYKRFRLSEVEMYGKCDQNYKHQIFYWKKGKVYRDFVLESSNIINTEEFMYIHFRSRPNFQINDEILVAEKILITQNGFVPLNDSVTIEVMDLFNHYSKVREKIEKILNDIGYNVFCHRIKKIYKLIRKIGKRCI